jgi:hypothetical protein
MPRPSGFVELTDFRPQPPELFNNSANGYLTCTTTARTAEG